MGYRSHFAVRDADELSLFASHWGGYRLLRDLLHGPEIFGAYVRTRRPCDELFYGDSVDGVALLDFPRRTLSFWGGDNMDIESVPGLRRHYLTLLCRRWADWTVEWMPLGAYDLAARLGHPPPEAPPDEFGVHVLTDDLADPRDGVPRSVLTIVDEAGVGRDLRSRWTVETLLSLGPSLLDAKRCTEPATLPRESIPDEEDHERGWSELGGIILQPTVRTIECWWNYPSARKATALSFLERFWPSWSLQLRSEGLPLHAHRSGRPSDGIELPRPRAAEYLEQRLFADDAIDFPQLARMEFEQLAEMARASKGAEITYSAGLLSDDVGLPFPDDLRGRIAALLDDG